MKKLKNKQDPLDVMGRSKGYTHKELNENLYRHFRFNPYILEQIKNTPDVVLRNLASPLAKKVNRMIKEIFTEAYRAKQFTRTEINNKGVLYGVIFLKHKVIDLVLKYFHKRWPECVICLYNEHTQTTGLINEGGIIQEIKQHLLSKLEQEYPLTDNLEDIINKNFRR